MSFAWIEAVGKEVVVVVVVVVAGHACYIGVTEQSCPGNVPHKTAHTHTLIPQLELATAAAAAAKRKIAQPMRHTRLGCKS